MAFAYGSAANAHVLQREKARKAAIRELQIYTYTLSPLISLSL